MGKQRIPLSKSICLASAPKTECMSWILNWCHNLEKSQNNPFLGKWPFTIRNGLSRLEMAVHGLFTLIHAWFTHGSCMVQTGPKVVGPLTRPLASQARATTAACSELPSKGSQFLSANCAYQSGSNWQYWIGYGVQGQQNSNSNLHEHACAYMFDNVLEHSRTVFSNLHNCDWPP